MNGYHIPRTNNIIMSSHKVSMTGGYMWNRCWVIRRWSRPMAGKPIGC